MMVILMHLVSISVNEDFSSHIFRLLSKKFGFNFKTCNGSIDPDSTLGNDSTGVTPETEVPETSIEQEYSEETSVAPLEEDKQKNVDTSFKESKISPGTSEESCIKVFCEIRRKSNEEGSSAKSSDSDPAVTQQLLMQAGDVESNPGPTESELKLTISYSRSLV